MKKLNYQKDFNNKLSCQYYTSIRLESNGLAVGDQVEAYVKKKKHHDAIVIDCRNVFLDSLNDFVTYLDAGCSAEEFKKIMVEFYPETDFKKERVSLLLFKKDVVQHNTKIALFCKFFKKYNNVSYVISQAEIGMINRVEVTEDLLLRYFESDAWWAKPKTVTGFVKNHNELRTLTVNNNPSGHPNSWDAEYFKKLTGPQISDYYRHLGSLGLEAVKDRLGAMIDWKPKN